MAPWTLLPGVILALLLGTELAALQLLWLLWHGERRRLRGLLCLTSALACMPLVGGGCDLLQALGLATLVTLAPIRRVLAYTLLNVGLWGLLLFLRRRTRGPSQEAP